MLSISTWILLKKFYLEQMEFRDLLKEKDRIFFTDSEA